MLLEREVVTQLADLQSICGTLIDMSTVGERYTAASRLLDAVSAASAADVMRTVSDRPGSASERAALADLARIAEATSQALAIIDVVCSDIRPATEEHWHERVAQFATAKRSIIRRWIDYALGNGHDPAVRNPAAVEEFLRYKPGTTEPYADNTRTTYTAYLDEWFTLTVSDTT